MLLLLLLLGSDTFGFCLTTYFSDLICYYRYKDFSFISSSPKLYDTFEREETTRCRHLLYDPSTWME